MSDLRAELRKAFPEYEYCDDPDLPEEEGIWLQDEPIVCKYEKKGHGGKVVTLLEGYTGVKEDFKALAKTLKSRLGVGGSIKGDAIVIQGDHREKVVNLLLEMGFKVKHAGG